jgi:PatG C-terminal
MHETDTSELSVGGNAVPPSTGVTSLHPGASVGVAPQSSGGKCGCGCGGKAAPEGAATDAPSYVYALGRVEPRFPSLAVEKEFMQVVGKAETVGLSDRQTLYAVLSKRENRYLARKLCWVFTIGGLETYLLLPRDPLDLETLVESIRPAPRPTDIDAVVGLLGPIAPPAMCKGLMVPVLIFDQLYSFDLDALVKSIPRPKKTPEEEFTSAAEELFMRMMQMTDNAGATDDHRALNYLALRYPAVYAKVAEEFQHEQSLTAVDVRPSALSSTRRMVDVVFTFTNRKTDVDEKFFVRVDVTEEFPFLVTKLSSYYDCRSR